MYPSTRTFRRIRVTALSLVIATLSVTSSASETQVPLTLQAELFKRIFAYDRSIGAGASIHVFVVYEDGDGTDAEPVVSAFGASGVDASAVELRNLGAFPEVPTAVYLLPDTPTAEVEAFCAAGSVLSLSGAPELAQMGSVAVAIGTEDDRPKIIVNLKRLKEEGHELSSELLKLARIVQ